MSNNNTTKPHRNTDLITMVSKYGSPLYIYDAQVIENQVNKMKKAFDGIDIKIKYAMKALNNINILKLMKKWDVGIDCVSLNEIKTAIMAGHSEKSILYTPSCVAFDEIQKAVDYGVKINIGDLPILEKFARHYKDKVPCCVRIRPGIMAGGHYKISTGHSKSKFGIPMQDFDKVLELTQKYQLVINGLHKHTGSDIIDINKYIEASDILFKVAKKISTLEYLDFGSGFKIAYKKGDKTTDIKTLGEKIVSKAKDFFKTTGKTLDIMIEPGKFLVSDAGYLLVTTTMVKETDNLNFVGIDTGLNHLIRPMMYEAYHEIENISNPNGEMKQYNIVGYMCETDDFAKQRLLPKINDRDILAIKNGGAYAITMASNYNSRARPAEVLIYKGKDYLIRKREAFEDIIANQIMHDFD